MSDGRTPEEPDRLPGAPHPRRTSVLFGQEAAEARFLAALASGRLPHGWLITGPRGIGKATLAWRIGRHLIAGGTGDSLQMHPENPVFRRVAALSAPEVFLCRRPWDEKSDRLRSAITIDGVRALKSHFQLSSADGGWRVAIVDAADEMTASAANALLKILEEPPPRAVLLLVCHRPARLLPTLRSRCRMLACLPLAPEPLAAALEAAGAVVPADAAAVLGALAGGSVGEALRLIAGDGLALYGSIVALMRRAPPLDRARAIALADSCAGRDAEARYDLLLGLLLLAVERLALAAAGGVVVPVSAGEAEVIAQLGHGVPQARLWADRAVALRERSDHARAVHLDPAQVILDTLLQIDTAAAQALAAAA